MFGHWKQNYVADVVQKRLRERVVFQCMLSSSFSYVTWLCEGCNSCKLSKSKWEKCKYSSGSYRSNLWRRITRNRSISSTYFVLQLLLRTVEILFKSAVQVYKQMIFRLSPLRHGVSPTAHSSPGLSRFGKKFYVPTCPLEWQEWASINLRTKNLVRDRRRGYYYPHK